jgi:transcriptional regulator with XRE-family HTH domain
VNGEELLTRRKEKGLGQRALAARSGIPQRTISRIETGRERARKKTAQKLAEALK